jgi:hypothetical protein
MLELNLELKLLHVFLFDKKDILPRLYNFQNHQDKDQYKFLLAKMHNHAIKDA